MKKHFKSIIIPVFTFLIGYSASAFSLPFEMKHPPAPDDIDFNRPPHRHPKIVELNQFTGKIASFGFNNDKVYDSINLEINGKTSNLKFPPHMGKAVMNLAKVNDIVSVNAFNETNPEGNSELRMESISKNNTTVFNTRPPRMEDMTEKVINIDSSIENFRYDRKGNINGLFLKDNIMVNLPPEIFNKIGGFSKGKNIKMTGIQRDNNGFVFADNTKMIDGKIINFENKNYLIR